LLPERLHEASAWPARFASLDEFFIDQMSLGRAIVMLRSAGVGREPFRSLPAAGSLIHCAVEDVDALYERARRAGAEIPLAPMDTDYGSRDFTSAIRRGPCGRSAPTVRGSARIEGVAPRRPFWG
jgi:hypothetical protein